MHEISVRCGALVQQTLLFFVLFKCRFRETEVVGRERERERARIMDPVYPSNVSVQRQKAEEVIGSSMDSISFPSSFYEVPASRRLPR